MKKTIAAAISLTLACAMIPTAFAAETAPPLEGPEGPALISEAPEETAGRYTFEINGNDISIDAAIMVPLRAVAEPLGFTVTWDNGTVLLDNGEMHTAVTIGLNSYMVATSVEGVEGMSAPFSLGAAPYIVNNTTYVPLELFDALLGSRAGTITLDDGKIKITTEETGSVQIPNPFRECGSLTEAGAITGFEMSVPESIPNYDRASILAFDSSMIQVLYQDGAETIRIRKAAGTDDISGDYNIYPETAATRIGGTSVTMKGGAGKAFLAVWTDGGYTYSVSASAGLGYEEMSRLICEVA